jgi:hypothetical protein
VTDDHGDGADAFTAEQLADKCGSDSGLDALLAAHYAPLPPQDLAASLVAFRRSLVLPLAQSARCD